MTPSMLALPVNSRVSNHALAPVPPVAPHRTLPSRTTDCRGTAPPAGLSVPVAQRVRRVVARAAQQEAPVAEDAADTRLPITIVTGFLGSGKTTLINHILTKPHGKRIALIENEFGEVGIDAELIVAREALDGDGELMLLENGCLCCTVREDLVAAVNKLVERGGFDHVVIETTGLANPAPIVSTFILEPSLQQSVRVDGICTVVDAAHVTAHLDRKDSTGEENEACAQLAYADRVILNKADLVSEDAMRELRERVRGINKLAALTETTKSDVPIEYVLGIGGYALDAVSNEVERELAELEKNGSSAHSHDHSHAAEEHCDECGHSHAPGEHDHAHNHDHKHDHDHDHAHAHAEGEEHCDDCGHSHAPGQHSHVHHKNVHDDAVKSASFVIDGAMDLAKLNLWLGALLEARGDDIYRMKGILNIQHNAERFVFQGVHQLFEGQPDREWEEGEARQSKMVFIGRNLDMELLKEGFVDCLAEEDAMVAS